MKPIIDRALEHRVLRPQPRPHERPFISAIHRERRPGMEVTIVERGKLRQFHITLRPLPGEQPQIMLRRLEGQLREHNALVIKQDVFGPFSGRAKIIAGMRELFRDLYWPITWVEGAATTGDSIAGVHVHAVAGAAVELVRLNSRIVGRIFEDGLARHCLLGDICAKDLSAPGDVQAWQVYENLETALVKHRMTLSNIVRTWVFLDDILSWYGAFNQVRTEIFTQRGLFTKSVPASTGVGAKNPYNAALVAAAWAVEPLDARIRIAEVPSPLQCDASGYGSCFSRAMELRAPDYTQLLISGTASIGQSGRSLRKNDPLGQIDLTMKVVKSILQSRRMDFNDVSRATVYLKQIEQAPYFAQWCRVNSLPMPAIVTQADICREELLFEIEVDAMKQTYSEVQARTPIAMSVSELRLAPSRASIVSPQQKESLCTSCFSKSKY